MIERSMAICSETTVVTGVEEVSSARSILEPVTTMRSGTVCSSADWENAAPAPAIAKAIAGTRTRENFTTSIQITRRLLSNSSACKQIYYQFNINAMRCYDRCWHPVPHRLTKRYCTYILMVIYFGDSSGMCLLTPGALRRGEDSPNTSRCTSHTVSTGGEQDER